MAAPLYIPRCSPRAQRLTVRLYGIPPQGHAFLRHVERCSTLVVVVDLSLGLKGGAPGPRPWEQFESMVEEIYEYDATLLVR